jgi:hypothetical protein
VIAERIAAVLGGLINNPGFLQRKDGLAGFLLWQVLLNTAGRIVLAFENSLIDRPCLTRRWPDTP